MAPFGNIHAGFNLLGLGLALASLLLGGSFRTTVEKALQHVCKATKFIEGPDLELNTTIRITANGPSGNVYKSRDGSCFGRETKYARTWTMNWNKGEITTNGRKNKAYDLKKVTDAVDESQGNFYLLFGSVAKHFFTQTAVEASIWVQAIKLWKQKNDGRTYGFDQVKFQLIHIDSRPLSFLQRVQTKDSICVSASLWPTKLFGDGSSAAVLIDEKDTRGKVHLASVDMDEIYTGFGKENSTLDHVEAWARAPFFANHLNERRQALQADKWTASPEAAQRIDKVLREIGQQPMFRNLRPNEDLVSWLKVQSERNPSLQQDYTNELLMDLKFTSIQGVILPFAPSDEMMNDLLNGLLDLLLKRRLALYWW